MPNDDIAVSVCCLAYNHEKYIRKTLEGFVCQKTNFKFEVFVHDDASTDNTVSIIKEYTEKYPEIIKPIFQTENQYSKGKKFEHEYIYPHMCGRYVAFCEGDDYWCDNNKLQKQFEVMESHPECSMCVHKVQYINEDGSDNNRITPEKQYGLFNGKINSNEVAKSIFTKYKCYPFHTSSYFIRKSVLNLIINAPYQNYLNGDEMIIRTAMNCGDFYYIDKIMSHRRLFSLGSYGVRFKEKNNEEMISYWEKNIEGNKIFDSYSNRRFHKYIQVYLFRIVLSLLPYDINNAKKILVENNIKFSTIFGKCRMKDYFSYCIIKLSPNIYINLRKLYHRSRKMD